MNRNILISYLAGLFDGEGRWNLSKKQLMMDATEELLPYLRIKKKIAERFIEVLRMMPMKRNSHRNHQRTLKKEVVLQITEIALSLNHRRMNTESLESKIAKINEVYEI